ncbi:MAG: hypothetical protein KC656_19715, partial [Myxococcales bacterium]|nr:hypothetical protein [Myxococcales bacterium]
MWFLSAAMASVPWADLEACAAGDGVACGRVAEVAPDDLGERFRVEACLAGGPCRPTQQDFSGRLWGVCVGGQTEACPYAGHGGNPFLVLGSHVGTGPLAEHAFLLGVRLEPDAYGAEVSWGEEAATHAREVRWTHDQLDVVEGSDTLWTLPIEHVGHAALSSDGSKVALITTDPRGTLWVYGFDGAGVGIPDAVAIVPRPVVVEQESELEAPVPSEPVVVEASSRAASVVDGRGRPVRGATVFVRGPGTALVTDGEGQVTVPAPCSEVVARKGREAGVSACGPEIRVVLERVPEVRVVDGAGRPIEGAATKQYPEILSDRRGRLPCLGCRAPVFVRWDERWEQVAYGRAVFPTARLRVEVPDGVQVRLVDAPGRPGGPSTWSGLRAGPALVAAWNDEASAIQTVELVEGEEVVVEPILRPEVPIRGRVLRPDGWPAIGAQVRGGWVYDVPELAEPWPTQQGFDTQTDIAGRYEGSGLGDRWLVAARQGVGFAKRGEEVDLVDRASWAPRVEGRFDGEAWRVTSGVPPFETGDRITHAGAEPLADWVARFQDMREAAGVVQWLLAAAGRATVERRAETVEIEIPVRERQDWASWRALAPRWIRSLEPVQVALDHSAPPQENRERALAHLCEHAPVVVVGTRKEVWTASDPWVTHYVIEVDRYLRGHGPKRIVVGSRGGSYPLPDGSIVTTSHDTAPWVLSG